MKTLYGLILAAFAAFFMPAVFSADKPAKLSWTAPTLNTDGTPLTDLAGYGLYVKLPGADDFIRVQDENGDPWLIPPERLSYDYVVEHPDGQLTRAEFQLTAFNSSGVESARSLSVFSELNDVRPEAPVLVITVSLNDDGSYKVTIAQN